MTTTAAAMQHDRGRSADREWQSHTRRPREPIPADEIADAVARAGSVSGAARLLRVHRNTLLYWMDRHGIAIRKLAVIEGGIRDGK